MKSLRPCLAVLGVVLLPSLLGAQDVPFLNGRVNDLAGLIPDDREEALESRLEAFELETGSQVVVLTVPDLGGDSDAAYASRVAEAWALGRESVDDGVLFLIARDDRKLRIEVGYGLEGALTDAESRRILDWIAVPAFRDGDFARGIEDATVAVLEEIRGEAPAPQGPPAWVTEDLERQRAAERRAGWVSVVLFALFMLFLIRMGRRRGRRRRAWSSRTGWGRPPIIMSTRPSRSQGTRRRPSRQRSSHSSPNRPRRKAPRSTRTRSGGFGGSFRGGGGRFGGGGASSGW